MTTTTTTTTPITPAGFIATAAARADQIAIYGTGATEAEAIADAVAQAGDPRYPAADYVAYPASAALLAQVETDGGAISWGTVRCVAVTAAEGEAATPVQR